MKRLIAVLAALAMLAGSGAAPSGTAEAAESCCWIYCEAYRDSCWFLFPNDREYCEAWFEGCMDGCQYPGSSGGGGGGGGGGAF